MRFEIDVGGRLRSVSVERVGQPDQFRVTIDGRPHEVNARRTGEHGLLLLAAAGTFPRKVPATSADKSQGAEG